MLGGKTASQFGNNAWGIQVSGYIYGKAVRLLYGLVRTPVDLIWYNNWQKHGSPVNYLLNRLSGQQSGKKAGKKGGQSYYSAAVDFLIGHAPIAGVLSAWWNNQKLNCFLASASGVISGGQFTFPVQAGASQNHIVPTIPSSSSGLPATAPAGGWGWNGTSYQYQAQNFVAVYGHGTGVGAHGKGYYFQQVDASETPGLNQFSVTAGGLYTFNPGNAGYALDVYYFQSTSASGGVLAGIVAVTVHQPLTATLDDYGGPGSVTEYGTQEIPLWNEAFPVPGRVDNPGAYQARRPYSFWQSADNAPTINVPSALEGLPVTVYYATPVVVSSDQTLAVTTETALQVLNLEFEPVMSSGSEYTNYPGQQILQAWCSGVGSALLDLGASNSMPNLLLEVIGHCTLWPNGDCDVADVLLDVISSGPSLVLGGTLTPIPHSGVNCNDYANGGFLTPSWPPSNGALLGDLTALRNWCRANGVHVALCVDAQRSAKDIVDELLMVGNSAAVYSGGKLNIVPYDEVSAIGAGATYTAPTASGPVATLTDQDLVSAGDKPPVTITRSSRVSNDNIAAFEFIDRANLDYAHNVVSEPNQCAVMLYGPRKGGSLSAEGLGNRPQSGATSALSIYDPAVAQTLASIRAKKSGAGVNSFSFTLDSRFYWVEAMDLVLIPDPANRTPGAPATMPVRLTSVREDPQTGKFQCEAELFCYGLHHPNQMDVTPGVTVVVSPTPGAVNTPVIFEPTAELAAEPELWFAVSGADPSYGGCAVYVSLDGDTTWSSSPIALCGRAITGVLTADYPLGADPDTTDTLAIDLTESNGEMSSAAQILADTFEDTCFVGGPLPFITVTNDVDTVPSTLSLWVQAKPTVLPGTIAYTVNSNGNIVTILLFASNGSTGVNGYAFRFDGRSGYSAGSIWRIDNGTWASIGASQGAANSSALTGQHAVSITVGTGGALSVTVDGVLRWTATDATYSPTGDIYYGYQVAAGMQISGALFSTAGYEVVCPTTATLTATNKYNLTGYIRRGALQTAPMDHPAGSRFAVLDGTVGSVALPPSWMGKILRFKFAAFNMLGGQQQSLADCQEYAYTPQGIWRPTSKLSSIQGPTAAMVLTTAEQALYSLFIPAGTIKPGWGFRLKVVVQHNGGTTGAAEISIAAANAAGIGQVCGTTGVIPNAGMCTFSLDVVTGRQTINGFQADVNNSAVNFLASDMTQSAVAASIYTHGFLPGQNLPNGVNPGGWLTDNTLSVVVFETAPDGSSVQGLSFEFELVAPNA